MRVYRRYVALERTATLVRILDRLRIPHTLDRKVFGDRASTTIEFRVFEDEPDFAEKVSALESQRLFAHEGTELTPEERESAPWFHLTTSQVGYPQPENGWFGQTYAPETSCTTCGCAGEQVAPFRFKAEPKAKRSAFFGLHWVLDAVFVRDEAKVRLEAEGIAGVRFTRPVLDRTGEPLTTIWQMVVATTLPEGVDTANLRLEGCPASAGAPFARRTALATSPFCTRKRFNFPTRGMLTFREETFLGAPDVVRTKEWFGSGSQSSRPVLVARRVKETIERAGLRGAHLNPVGLSR